MSPNVQQFIDDVWSAQQVLGDAALASKDAAIAAKDAVIAQATADLAATQQSYAAYQQKVLDRWGPLGFFDWDETKVGTPLDLTGYVETFRDDFNAMSVTRKDGAGPWYASVHANFDSSSSFLQPGDYWDPYGCENGELRIGMIKLSATSTPKLPANSRPFKSGLMQTVNAAGQGFTQAMGYFEARMKFPTNGQGNATKMPGSWPAFWLLTNDVVMDPAKTQMEFDVVEAYGNDPSGHHATLHYKPAAQRAPGAYSTRQSKANYADLYQSKNLVGDQSKLWGVNGNMFNGQYKTYGVMFGDEITQVFVDGLEICRCPTYDWMKSPVYMLVDLALFGQEQSLCASPQYMFVDEVLAFRKA